MKKDKIYFILLFFSLLTSYRLPVIRLATAGETSPAYAGRAAYIQVSCITHIHSTFSDSGKLTLEEIVKKAIANDINIIIPTDHDMEKIEYGLWPLRKIIKKTVERNSVFLIGTEKYLAEIKRLQEKYPEIVIIPGIESSPYYYWTGSPFKKNLLLNDWHKHMTIVGLDKTEQYKKLPITSNSNAREFDPILLWPVVFLLIGLLLNTKYKHGIIIIITSIILLAYNFPFKTYSFSPYLNNLNELPYQNLINYVNSENGLIFWAHPEARNWKEPYNAGNVSLKSPPYPESILNTQNYTGFAYFWEGANTIGSPGGYWDKALNEYCENRREKPLWAIAELDYIKDGLQNNYINLNKNILLVNNLTETDAIDAFRKGRFFITSKNSPNSYDPILKNFTIRAGNKTTTFGEKLEFSSKVKIFFSISTNDNKPHKFKVKIIESGKITKIIENLTPANIVYEFTPLKNRTYVRIEINFDNSSKLVTNPVFLYNE